MRGASGILDEVDEARRVVERVAEELRDRGVDVKTFHDDTSHSQNENLKTIVNYHNAQTRELDVSVHFNAFEQIDKPMGTEVLYVTQSALAGQLSAAIASCGFINRGAKKRTDLYFLNNTEMPSVLLEICFVDSIGRRRALRRAVRRDLRRHRRPCSAARKKRTRPSRRPTSGRRGPRCSRPPASTSSSAAIAW